MLDSACISYDVDVTINSKLFAMNLLCKYVNSSWKSNPNADQQQIIQFAESYLFEGVSVFYCCISISF